MFKNISWENYWEFVLITLFVYYVTIGCLYYLQEIKQVVSGKSNLLLKLNGLKRFPADGGDNHSTNVEAENELPTFVNEYINEAKNIIEYAAENNLIKRELLYSLQQLSKKYLNIKSSPFQKFTNSYILTKTSNYSSIHISEDEVNALWVM